MEWYKMRGTKNCKICKIQLVKITELQYLTDLKLLYIWLLQNYDVDNCRALQN
jgi:hypothetical protein